jgi:hypothetical protein
MFSTLETAKYDIHISFEPYYDETPRLYVYELYKDRNGDWNSKTQQTSDSYYLSKEEATELAKNLCQEDYYDLELDEWLSNTDSKNLDYLPESVKYWTDNLEPYTTEDYSTDTKEN